MFLERRTISRKTPGDGRLELTKPAALRVEAAGDSFALEVGSEKSTVTINTFECTCRGPENRHVHYFLQSDLLKQLEPSSEVDVELDAERRRIRLRPVR